MPVPLIPAWESCERSVLSRISRERCHFHASLFHAKSLLHHLECPEEATGKKTQGPVRHRSTVRFLNTRSGHDGETHDSDHAPRSGHFEAQSDRAPPIPALSRRQPAADGDRLRRHHQPAGGRVPSSARAELRCAARSEGRGRRRRHHHRAEPGARRLRVRTGGEEGSIRGRRAHALGLSPERRGRQRDPRCQPHRLREVQHSRPAPDRCAQGRYQREDLRRDMGQPDLLLPGQQPRRLQPGGGGRRGARRRQAPASDDPLHGR